MGELDEASLILPCQYKPTSLTTKELHVQPIVPPLNRPYFPFMVSLKLPSKPHLM